MYIQFLNSVCSLLSFDVIYILDIKTRNMSNRHNTINQMNLLVRIWCEWTINQDISLKINLEILRNDRVMAKENYAIFTPYKMRIQFK